MRWFLMALLLLPAAGAAEDLRLRPPVTAVTVYPQYAQIVRQADVRLPAGDHIIVFEGLVGLEDSPSLRLPDGLQEIDRQLSEITVPLSVARDSQIYRNARARIETVQAEIRSVEAEIAELRLAQSIFDTQRQMLAGLTVDPDGRADDLGVLAARIAEILGRSGAAAIAADATAQALEPQLSRLEAELALAMQAFDTLPEPPVRQGALRLRVRADTDVDGPVALSYITYAVDGWVPRYDIHLSSGAPDVVRLSRSVLIGKNSAGDWTDVDLTLSTLIPGNRSSHSSLWPNRVETYDPQATVGRPETAGLSQDAVAASPPVVEESRGGFAAYALGVEYRLDRPVTILGNSGWTQIALPDVTLTSDLRAVAVPRRDDNAYLMVVAQNTSGAPLINGDASMYIDGSLVAENRLPAIQPGDETVLGFGPIQGLLMERTVLSRSTGDAGIVNRQNVRREDVRIDLRNESGRDWDLRLIDQVPYSEEEDLVVEWDATPVPDVENLDDQRGILAWDLMLTAGDALSIRLNTTLSWPNDLQIR